MSQTELLIEQNRALAEQNRLLVAQNKALRESQSAMSAMFYQSFRGITSQLEQKFGCGKPPK